MKVEEQEAWSKKNCEPALEEAGKAAFLVDWPKDDWDRLGDGYHQARYRKIAEAAIRRYLEVTRDVDKPKPID